MSLLGTPNKATGTPLKIGFAYDGQTQAADATSELKAVKATVQYSNDYLGGINGHAINLDVCDTQNTPATATSCSVQLVRDKVAAIVAPVSGQDANLFKGIEGSGIPYFTDVSATSDILTKPGAFILSNPLAELGAMVELAKSEGVKRSAIILIDVPAAAGLAGIATPVFQKAGIKLDIVKVSPTVADMSPQVQQALGQGDKQFEVAGTTDFDAKGIKALKQAGFNGDIIVSGWTANAALAKSIPGGFEGVTNLTSINPAANDPDARLFGAIMGKYSPSSPQDAQAQQGFVTMLAFVRALTGVPSAVDARSIMEALSAMPKPIPLPFGKGITFQCGVKQVSFLPNVCTTKVLTGKLDADGNGIGIYKVIDVTDVLKLS